MRLRMVFQLLAATVAVAFTLMGGGVGDQPLLVMAHGEQLVVDFGPAGWANPGVCAMVRWAVQKGEDWLD